MNEVREKKRVMKNRLAIFVFWEKNGIVRDYIVYYLKGLQKVAGKVYVVVNGLINDEGKKKIETLGIHVLVRENEGVDFWAYKTGLDKEGDLRSYDEVILANCSCYGPIYPFENMFLEMSERKVDFWGITEWPLNEGGYKGTWVLSYFIVVRPKMFLGETWKEWWKNLTPVHSREECIFEHEIKFTKYFADHGYQYDVYCPTTTNYIDPTIEGPEMLVIEQKCPIIKRKAFCTDYQRVIDFHRGDAALRVFNYIKEHNLYDTQMIIDDMLATQHYFDIKNMFHLNYFLPSYYVEKPLKRIPKVVVCFHVYYEDLLEHCFAYMKEIPDYMDIFITTPKENLVSEIEKNIERYKLKNVKVKVIDARGRAEAAFLVACKDFILDYDYACILHDKKSNFLRPGILGLEFGFHNQDALLKTRAYIENIITLFEENPKLGMLEPINLIYGNFQRLYGNEWGPNFDGTKKFLERARIDLPISIEVPPVFPAGAMFWFRPKCMQKLIEMDWEYEDFPAEPLPVDGSLIHIIERAYPFIVQDAGYLTGWVSTIEDAEVHLTSVSYLYRKRNVVSESYGPPRVIGLKLALKIYFDKHFFAPIRKILKND